MEATQTPIAKHSTVTEFRTSIFERTRERTVKRVLYNVAIFGIIGGIWILALTSALPVVGIKTAMGITIALLSWKVYDDRYMGITAYGVRKDR